MVKGTIKDGEPILNEKVRGYISLMRPMTMMPAFIAGVVISGFSLVVNGQPLMSNWATLIYIGVTMALLQGGSQAINQSYEEEVEIDKINDKDYRPIPRGILSESEGISIGFLLILFGITRAFTITPIFGLFSVLVAFFGLFYTLPPLRIKRFFLLNNIWQGISRGFLPIIACSSVFGSLLNPVNICWAIVTFIWVVGAQSSKDLLDVKGDRAYGIKTIPVTMGKKGTIQYISLVSTVSYVWLAVFSIKVFPEYFNLLWLTIIPTILIILSLKKEWKIKKLENNAGWVLYYITLALWFFLPVIGYFIL